MCKMYHEKGVSNHHTLLFFPPALLCHSATTTTTTSLSPLKKTPMNKKRVAKNDAYSWRQSTTADRKPRYGADRSDLFEVRCTPGTRVQRRAETYEEALLHQFRLDKLPSGGRGEKVYAISYHLFSSTLSRYIFTKEIVIETLKCLRCILGVVKTE